MSNDIIEDMSLDEFREDIEKQAESADIGKPDECSEENCIKCATPRGDRAVENKILISISENINTMAETIKESESQKHSARKMCIIFFIVMMMFLTFFAIILICADTFWGVNVRIESIVSVILSILADVIAIVHTLVKYMTNTENYEAYGKLIESFLKYTRNK